MIVPSGDLAIEAGQELVGAGRLGMNLRLQITNFRGIWWCVRQVLGDAAYENYLRSQRRRARSAECHHGSGPGAEAARLLSREEFYLDMLRRRYSGVSRCC